MKILLQNPRLTTYARENRKAPTRAENIFWVSVRNRKFEGLKFKRQTPLGQFIADFYCDEYKLIVEIDGKGHNYEKDKLRDNWFIENGYAVIHINDELVITSTELAMNKIRNALKNLTLIPSPKGEGSAPSLSFRRGNEGEVIKWK